MKFSAETLDIIKNFSRISPEMIFREGNLQFTATQTADMLAKVRFNEDITQSFSISDIRELLGILSLYKSDMDVAFTDTSLEITGLGGKSKISYRFAENKTIKTRIPTDIEYKKGLGSLSKDVTFDIDEAHLNWIVKNAQLMESTHISISSNGELIKITNFCEENDAAPTQSLEIGDSQGHTFRAVYNPERFGLIMPDDYEVAFNSHGVLILSGKNKGITYFIAANKSSVRYNK